MKQKSINIVYGLMIILVTLFLYTFKSKILSSIKYIYPFTIEGFDQTDRFNLIEGKKFYNKNTNEYVVSGKKDNDDILTHYSKYDNKIDTYISPSSVSNKFIYGSNGITKIYYGSNNANATLIIKEDQIIGVRINTQTDSKIYILKNYNYDDTTEKTNIIKHELIVINKKNVCGMILKM